MEFPVPGRDQVPAIVARIEGRLGRAPGRSPATAIPSAFRWYRGRSSPTSPPTPHRLPRTARRTMTSPLEPSPSGDAAAVLAVQVAALRGQVRLIFARLDMAGITGDLNLADQFAELARAVTQALDSPPRGPLPLTGSASTPPATPAGVYGTPAVGRRHLAPRIRRLPAARLLGRRPHAIWELSTLAAEWHRTYSGNRPGLDRALDSTTGGSPAPCAESATSPAGATPNAPGGQRRRQPTDSRPSLSSRRRLRKGPAP